jgi:hypothetical protein
MCWPTALSAPLVLALAACRSLQRCSVELKHVRVIVAVRLLAAVCSPCLCFICCCRNTHDRHAPKARRMRSLAVRMPSAAAGASCTMLRLLLLLLRGPRPRPAELACHLRQAIVAAAASC